LEEAKDYNHSAQNKKTNGRFPYSEQEVKDIPGTGRGGP
jgi:hypothetical protein